MIELKDESISAAALKIVLDSIYSGDLPVNDENIFEVLVAADHLQVTSVVQQCCDYLQTQFVDQLRFDVQTYCLVSAIAARHGLKDLQEATQTMMAYIYKEICESDQYTHLLCGDDLSAASETFVFKSVMQWIKHKRGEKMTIAAKVIGAVRLGLVDIRDLIEELNTEEMQRVPEIHTLLFESSLYHNCPSNTSKFAKEKAKLRSTSPVSIWGQAVSCEISWSVSCHANRILLGNIVCGSGTISLRIYKVKDFCLSLGSMIT